VPQLENIFNFDTNVLLFIGLNPIDNEILKKNKKSRSWTFNILNE